MKVYKNGIGLGKDLKKLISNTNQSALPKVMNEFVSNCNDQHLAPKLTGALQSQISYGISTAKGTITWEVIYARRRWFEGSISGVALWGEVCKKRNYNKYVSIIKETFEEEKRKL